MSEPTEEKCNHVGQWRGLGTTAINAPKEIIIIHNLFCKRCGIAKTSSTRVPIGSPIAVPKVVLKKGLN